MSKLSTDPYKGVRDLYPEDMWLLKHIFDVMRKTAETYGYEEYGASPLEPAELYRAKTGEEIVNEQTYTFKDRGDREVTLRPEMTPTVARMVAGRKRDLGFPLRWYSIPNLFRYENPQKGRLREHYQLNVDIFGLETIDAEIEIISVASTILKNFGAQEKDFSILINSRSLMRDLFVSFSVNEENQHILSKLIDKKEKVEKRIFEEGVGQILKEKTQEFLDIFYSNKKIIEHLGNDASSVKQLITVIEGLSGQGITNVIFTPTLMRGFDYYTDIIFEIFDTNPENRRSLFGGGRYDNLTELFNGEKVPAVGFGMGDVTLADFLRTHNLIPSYTPNTHLLIASINSESANPIITLAGELRKNKINVAIDTTDRKIGDKIKSALKLKIPFFLALGEDEIKQGSYKLKNLKTEVETTVTKELLIESIKKS